MLHCNSSIDIVKSNLLSFLFNFSPVVCCSLLLCWGRAPWSLCRYQ